MLFILLWSCTFLLHIKYKCIYNFGHVIFIKLLIGEIIQIGLLDNVNMSALTMFSRRANLSETPQNSVRRPHNCFMQA